MNRLNKLPPILLTAFSIFLSSETVLSAKLLIGPTRDYTKPSDVTSLVKNGDTVEIDPGTYSNQSGTWKVNDLTLHALSGFAHLTAPSNISNGKAIWVIQGNNTVIENIEFSGASVPDQNGAGIRIEGGNITIRNCFFHDNENGILGGSGSLCNVTIENSEFSHNGFGDGYSHNMYIGNAASFTLIFSYTHHAKIGHTIKSRAQINQILYNRIMDEADGTASYEVDLPNGGTSYLIGNIIQQGPLTDNPAIITYGEEGLSNTGKDLYVINNTIVNDRASGTFISIASGALRAKVCNNLFVGPGTTINGSADTTTNISTNNPGFLNRTLYDYRLRATAPGINKGSDPGIAANYPLMPKYNYSYDCSGNVRINQGGIDIGAFEFNSTGTALIDKQISTTIRNTRYSQLKGTCTLLGRKVQSESIPLHALPVQFLVRPEGYGIR